MSQQKFIAPTGAYWMFGEGTVYPEGDFYSPRDRASIYPDMMTTVPWRASITAEMLSNSKYIIHIDPDLEVDEGL